MAFPDQLESPFPAALIDKNINDRNIASKLINRVNMNIFNERIISLFIGLLRKKRPSVLQYFLSYKSVSKTSISYSSATT